MKTEMIPEQPPNWMDLAKVLIYILAPFALIWRFIDKWYEERSKNKEEFIKMVVKEVLESSIEPIKTQITRLQEHTDRGFEQVHKRVDEVFKEINK